MSAKTIARALGGRKVGGGWMARRPAHDDLEPSLSIRDADDGKVLVRYHAGCDQERVIATLRSRSLWTGSGPRRLILPAHRAAAASQPNSGDAKRSRSAHAIWQSANSPDGSLVETYLASRGLHLPPPPTLRLRAGLKHPPGGIWPAMVGPVTRGSDDAPLAIHRTVRTVANDADGRADGNDRGGAAPARANPLKTNARTAADDADANRPPQSASEKTGAPGWGARL
jgi:putative DNA primase/helicase